MRPPPESELGYCIERELVGRAQPVIDALRGAGLSVVTAESCTGGLIAAILSHAQNASDSLHGGFVVYTKANKSKVLGVDRELLESQGAVNEEIAHQMAQGALKRSAASVAVSDGGTRAGSRRGWKSRRTRVVRGLPRRTSAGVVGAGFRPIAT
jgi:PncC family amidohydrolase